MTLTLYFHPFSSFCQKVLIALYERDVAFAPRIVDLSEAAERAMLEALSPIGKFPVLRDEEAGRTIAEASVIVEYLDRFRESPPLVPGEREAALDVRYWDRLFDLYVMTPMQKAVADSFRPEGTHDSFGVEEAKAILARSYRIVDEALAQRQGDWICGPEVTLADCAAAPSLFYAGMVVPFDAYPRLVPYFARLRARPSFSRAVDEARPYRAFFPLGWREGWD
ncbi:MAG TPA: glutathione S-transferase family protein [Allosphingosinicella sp.]|jgi:glutathione S-transferase